MIGERNSSHDTVICALKTAEPDPIQFELKDRGLPRWPIVWKWCCETSCRKEFNARVDVFPLSRIEISHYHDMLIGGPPGQCVEDCL